MHSFIYNKDYNLCAAAPTRLYEIDNEILAVAQALANAYREDNDADIQGLLPVQYDDTELSKWVCADVYNYNWGLRYMKALHDQRMKLGFGPSSAYTVMYAVLLDYWLADFDLETLAFNEAIIKESAWRHNVQAGNT